MTIYEFADVCNLIIEVRYYPNQGGRWSAHFQHTEVIEGSMLKGEFENGKTSDEAVQNYWHALKGKRIAVNAMSEKYRREYTVPA